MKGKDIQIGAEYAAGPSNADHWSQMHRARVRVLKVGVYGSVWSGYHRGASEHPSYVEVEMVVVGDRGGKWSCEVSVETGKLVTRGGFAPETKVETVQVIRIPYGQILKPWEEYAEERDQALGRHAKMKAQDDVQDSRNERLVAELKVRGFSSAHRGRSRSEIVIDLSDVERLLKAVPK